MKKLLVVIFGVLPIFTFATSTNHTATSTQTKSEKTVVRKVESKKVSTTKTVSNPVKKKAQVKKLAKTEPTKTKGKQPVEQSGQTVVKSKQNAVKKLVKIEKVTTNSVEAVAQKKVNTVTKSVVVPRCNDSKVFAVLSDAFKKQGAATNTQMTVKQIAQARETQSYPQQGIRSCNAIVETNSVKYVTDYSIILNDKGFFVQVENAQPEQRF